MCVCVCNEREREREYPSDVGRFPIILYEPQEMPVSISHCSYSCTSYGIPGIE